MTVRALLLFAVMVLTALCVVLAFISKPNPMTELRSEVDASGLAAFVALGCEPRITETGALDSGCDKIKPLQVRP